MLSALSPFRASEASRRPHRFPRSRKEGPKTAQEARKGGRAPGRAYSARGGTHDCPERAPRQPPKAN
eukprot:7955797-Pyramimonas_sp.AAC.1